MTNFKSDFLRILDERGFIHQISDAEGLDSLCARQSITGYIGFDATATSLHVGSLIQIMMLHWMQHTGHRPITLMGGGTSLVGDPSFKDETRKLITPEDIERNITGIQQIFAKFLTYEGATPNAIMANNADWLLDLKYVDFLRDVGRHFSVNRMLSFDSVKTRLDREQSLSFLEFNYMILQAYDFVELNRRSDCVLQMGGSDQWGNMVNGIDLGHRMNNQQFYVLTSPLLTTASGQKMGKSLHGAIWLNAEMLSPYEFWQYWRNTEDADVERFLKLYTTLPMSEITKLAALAGNDINDVKKILATEVTTLVHGRNAAEDVANTARATFETGALDLSLPTVELNASDLKAGIGLLAIFVTAGLAKSNGEARRHLNAGALKVNDSPVDDERTSLSKANLLPEGVIKLSVGKKRHVLLKPV